MRKQVCDSFSHNALTHNYFPQGHKTMTKNTLSLVTSLSRPTNLIEPQEQVWMQPLLSVESLPCQVFIFPANHLNHVSMVM